MNISNEPADPFEQSRRVREHIQQHAAELLERMRGGGIDHNGHPVERKPNPARVGEMNVVMNGNKREVGELVDHLMDRVEQLEAQLAAAKEGAR